MRAVRYSSTLSAFHDERRSIKLMLLYNSSYPPRYVYNWFNQFFSSHFSISAVSPTINSEHDFARLRCLLLNRPTIPEHQIASRIAKAIKNNPKEEINDSLVKARLNKQLKFDTNLIIHYTYEKRHQNNNWDIK
jgi:hypothetical protein